MAFVRALVLSLTFSIAITTVVAGILGFLPHGERGWLSPALVVVALGLASAGLFFWGLRRGAYPRLVRRPAQAPVAAEATPYPPTR